MILKACVFSNSPNLKDNCKLLADSYDSNINGDELYEEIIDCKMLLSSRSSENVNRPEQLLIFIVKYGDESLFPNLGVALQISLSIAFSIASCERSFSKPKLILTYLRSTMGQERLSDLALLSIEQEATEGADFEHNIILSTSLHQLSQGRHAFENLHIYTTTLHEYSVFSASYYYRSFLTFSFFSLCIIVITSEFILSWPVIVFT